MFKEKVEEIIGKTVKEINTKENSLFFEMTDGTVCKLTKDDFGLFAVYFEDIFSTILRLNGKKIEKMDWLETGRIHIKAMNTNNLYFIDTKGIKKINEIEKSPFNEEVLMKVIILTGFKEKELTFQCFKQEGKWFFSTFFKDESEVDFECYKKLAQEIDLCNHKEVRIKLIV